MKRLVFTFFLLFHGLLHLPGFITAFSLARINELTGKTLLPLSGISIKIAGILWLFTGLLFTITAIAYLVKKKWWWLVGAIAVIISQLLILIYWPDAKFGTIANIILLLAVMAGYGNWRFQALVRQELQPFINPTNQPKVVLTAEMLTSLPPIVQQWLLRCQVVGKEVIQTVHLKQAGQMRTQPAGKWMPVTAEQYFTVPTPGFLWLADVKAAPLVHLAGRDKYYKGHGHMLVKLFSLFPVANAHGQEIDQGTLLRYLAEIVWFPSAALQNYITWEQMDATVARVTMRYGDISASGIFTFTPAGDFLSFEAKRYYDRKTGATLETWFVAVDGDSYKTFSGIRIPAKSTVTWKLATGDFTWFQVEILDVIYNQASLATQQVSRSLQNTPEQYEITE